MLTYTIHRSFSYWIGFAAFGVLAVVLANVPLFDILAYEFCAIIGLCISVVGGYVALTTLQQMKRTPGAFTGRSRQVVFRCFWNALIFNIGLLVLPLGIILLNSFRAKNCNLGEGLLFFAILPLISCLYATAAGLFFGFWIKGRGLAYLAYLGYLVLSGVPVVINLILHPPVFAYHPTFGYFPGPIYDFVIRITGTLLLARAEALLWGLLFLELTVALYEVNRTTGLIPQLNWRKLAKPLTKRVPLYLLVLSLAGFQFYAGALGVRPTREDIARKLGGFRETANFEIFYARELQSEIERIAADCEFQYAQLSAYLVPEGQPLPRKVRAYLYVSPEQKKRLIGAHSTSVEDPFGYGFHIHAQGFPHPVLKHELAHVFTVPWSPLKVSLKVGLHEGIAVAADWNEGRLTGHQWAKAMQQMELAPPLSDIMGVGFWGHAGSRSYLLAGSFVRFLVDTYGIEKFKNVFPTGNFAKHYGKDLNALETAWTGFLEDIPLKADDIVYATYRLQRRSVFERVCAHEMAARRDAAWHAYYQKDFITAVQTFETMLSAEPDNLRTLRGLMYSAYRLQDYEKALALATRIARAEDTRFSPEAALLKGDIYWLRGEREKAIEAYTSVNTEYEAIARRRTKRMVGLSYPDTSQDLLRAVLVESTAAAEKMAHLSTCIRIEPKMWLADFLAGELLHREGAWGSSTPYLQRAATLLKEDERTPKTPGRLQLTPQAYQNLGLEVGQMIGINAYHQKDYETAIKVFSYVAKNEELPLGTTLKADEWQQRCRWAESHRQKAISPQP